MKASGLIFMLLLASSVAVVQLAAQQTKAHQKPIGEVKAKAEAGDAESQVELGRRYEQGKGVAKDQVEAVKWYRKAAEQNYAKAQNNLGACYEHGEGVAKDQVEAIKWFRKAGRMWMMPGSCGQPIRNESRISNEDRAGQITTGDENFAVMLKQQSPEFREQIRERFSDNITTQPISKPKPYIKRYFPKTYKLLFGP